MRNCKVCNTPFDGRRCPECHRRINKQNRLNNPERVKAYVKQYQIKNKEALKAYRKEYAEKNKEKIRQKKREYAAANSKKIVEKVRVWRTANPDAKREQSHNYRAVKRSSGKLSYGIAKRLYTAQKGLCACCGCSLEDGYQIDHIIPLAKGGLNVDDNVQLLLPICNQRKHAKMPGDFLAEYGGLSGLV